MQTTISVVIPAFDAAEYLPRALDSARAQTRPPDEILVVDDGSTDDTAEVAGRYGSPVRVISHEHNRGLSAARNTGVIRAEGEWIALLDADDLWYPRKLERQLEALREAPEDVGMLFCFTRIVRPDGTDWIDSEDAPSPNENSGGFIRELLVRNVVSGSGCSPVVRRDLLRRVGGFDETLRTCEDWDLWLRIAGRAAFWRVDEVLCEGYARPDGLGRKRAWLLADADTVLQQHLPSFVPDAEERRETRRRALELISEHAGRLEKGAA